GEVVRPVVLPMRDRNVRPAAAFVTIVIERVYDTLTVVFAFAVSLAFLNQPQGSSADIAYVQKAGWFLVTFGIVVVVGLFIFRVKSQSIIGWYERVLSGFPRLPIRIKRAVLSLLEQLARALGILANVRELAVTIAWTIALWASVVGANMLIFRAFDVRVGGRP